MDMAALCIKFDDLLMIAPEISYILDFSNVEI